MGVIINPRGTSGSAKTEFVRRILSDYGGAKGGHVEPVHREGRERPMAYRLRHPLGGRPLTVLFHYAAPGEEPHPLRYPEITERLTELVVIVSLTGCGLKLDRPVGWRS
jgi:hypothetical protein